ncbi:hypothetical protein ACM46_16915 [Chryseobacterium angstadtii]|uniref:Uncharacterized protein n=1 Tax=Chryseobacterium angstadtii TaxID=558151 RepID=A0A0J7KRS8_9FLAO|nr:hypothetical protein [Chryseobacterium angstadtii]KMQ59940.1 hypothetical protein ACM46_16915 [Chryseobacterium angstadtii]
MDSENLAPLIAKSASAILSAGPTSNLLELFLPPPKRFLTQLPAGSQKLFLGGFVLPANKEEKASLAALPVYTVP